MAQAQLKLRSVGAHFFAVCGLASLVATSDAAPSVVLIEPGLYDASTVSLRSGSDWLGLFPASGARSASLRAVALEAKAAAPPNDLPGEKALSIRVGGAVQPLFLLHGLKLKPRAVRSLAFQEADSDSSGSVSPTSLPWNGRGFVFGDHTQRQKNGDRKSWLSLSQGGKTQVLADYPSRDSASLSWAGDLDGDGKLDLYVSISHHNYNAEGVLFLSSKARRGQFVGESASWSARRFEE